MDEGNERAFSQQTFTDMSSYPLKVHEWNEISSTAGKLLLRMFAKKFNCSFKYYGEIS